MTPAVQAFVASAVRDGYSGPVLDIGSFDVNGTARQHFPHTEYIGLDMRPGPGVDIVGSSHAIPFDNGVFGAVVCLEMLEHDSDPFQTVAEINRVTQPGALILLSARGIGFKKHDYPKDYWRFTAESMLLLMALAVGSSRPEAPMRAWEDEKDQGVFAVGRRA
jgi:SAM-dependent methyltransferase